MNEQQQIAAIDALVSLMQEKMVDQWDATDARDKDSARDAVVNYLRSLHNNGIMQGNDVCTYLLHKHWTEATPEEATICENAVQAMREVIESE